MKEKQENATGLEDISFDCKGQPLILRLWRNCDFFIHKSKSATI